MTSFKCFSKAAEWEEWAAWVVAADIHFTFESREDYFTQLK